MSDLKYFTAKVEGESEYNAHFIVDGEDWIGFNGAMTPMSEVLEIDKLDHFLTMTKQEVEDTYIDIEPYTPLSNSDE